MGPPDAAKAALDQIVYAILDALKPWPTTEQLHLGLIQDEGAQLAKKTNVSAEIEKAVREDIECLLGVTQTFYAPDAKGRTRVGAKLVLASLARLETQILRAVRNSPEMVARLRGRQLGLEWLREECNAAIAYHSGKTDQCKVECARAAMYLMVRFSKNNPTSGSRDSPFRKIATLFYQAISGDKDQDIERACEEVLGPMRPLL